MTAKDYIRIAAAFSRTKPSLGLNEDEELLRLMQWNDDIAAVTLALKADNPRFNTACFLRACTTEEQDA